MLKRGPKFCATSPSNFHELKGETRKFTRRIILQEQFFDQTYQNNSLVRKPSNKFISSNNDELNGIINKLHKIDPAPINTKNNLEREEKVAFSQLKVLAKSAIEIKKADKSDTWVLMDKERYRQMILKEHLLTKTYVQTPLDANKVNNLVKLVTKFSDSLTKNEVKFTSDDDWHYAFFYDFQIYINTRIWWIELKART